jgi:tRNA(Arg) A34 adenosine deaminase TadA
MQELTSLITRLFDVIEFDIVPKTRAGVARGNKLFGAAILRKDDRSLVVAETNNELENPIWHGEVHTIKRFYELDSAARPAPAECVFLSTHEPCSLCLSAITWCGFDNFYYLFSYEDSRDSFNIPHDLKILKEVFGLAAGGYRSSNAYWKAHALPQLVDQLEPKSEVLRDRLGDLKLCYHELSSVYQSGKGRAGIPLE